MDLLQERIWEKIDQHDSVRKAAAELGVDHSYLYRLAQGEKNEPGEKLLSKLGLRRVVIYVDKKYLQS